MDRTGPRIILIGGTYRALCVLERLMERGERVVAFIGQEGGGERDFCPEILEICDRYSIPARSAHKLGEEIVRWLEDRIRPDLAIAVGTSMEIPIAIGGNTRLGLIEVTDFFSNETCPGVVLRQRGQDVLVRKVPPPGEHVDGGDAYLHLVEEIVAALDEYLDGLPDAAPATRVRVPFDAPSGRTGVLTRTSERSEPGPETDALERELASWLGAEHVLALRRPADAWDLLARALAIADGERVICPGLVSRRAPAAFAARGASLVFADVEPRLLTLDPDGLSPALTDGARVLLIAHPFGQPAALDRLYPIAAEAGLEVIEDGGAGLGARFGASRLGRAPCTTVFRLPLAAGEPGLEAGIVTLSPALAKAVAPLAESLRLGDGSAALARTALADLDNVLSARRANARAYSELSRYDAFRVPATPDERMPTYSSFVLGITRFARTSADDLHKLLGDSGIETRRLALAATSRDLADLPVAEQARTSSVLLPVHPGLREIQLEVVLDAIFGYAIG